MMKVWILIRSRSGIFFEPEIFYDEEDATERKLRLMKHSNPSYDEIEVFQKEVLTGLPRRTKRSR